MATPSCVSEDFKAVACSHRKGKKISNLPFLPEEIWFKIFLQLPIEVIQELRSVCRLWHNIICNPTLISGHLQQSCVGVLIQKIYSPTAQFRSLNGDMTPLHLPFSGEILHSCDGLLLIHDDWDIKHVLNPITKQSTAVAPFTCSIWNSLSFSLAYAHSTGLYKVVCTLCDENNTYRCMILTMGKEEEWRAVDIRLLSETAQKAFRHTPVRAREFVFWIDLYSSYFLRLDVDSETVTKFSCYKDGAIRLRESYHELGGSLYCCSTAGLPELGWTFWVLKDTDGGEWVKLYTVDLQGLLDYCSSMFQAKSFKIERLVSVKSDEVVILRAYAQSESPELGQLVAYNLRTQEILQTYKLEPCRIWLTHVNSLVFF